MLQQLDLCIKFKTVDTVFSFHIGCFCYRVRKHSSTSSLPTPQKQRKYSGVVNKGKRALSPRKLVSQAFTTNKKKPTTVNSPCNLDSGRGWPYQRRQPTVTVSVRVTLRPQGRPGTTNAPDRISQGRENSEPHLSLNFRLFQNQALRFFFFWMFNVQCTISGKVHVRMMAREERPLM